MPSGGIGHNCLSESMALGRELPCSNDEGYS